MRDGSSSVNAMTTAAFREVRWSGRPSRKLLDDVRARKIDVIIVYKVDRLTRSLADFDWPEFSEDDDLGTKGSVMPGATARRIMREAGVYPGLLGAIPVEVLNASGSE